MIVVGTAGHIDHGKSTLVTRLTGTDPDRLAEEKQRGMTIDLGFAWLRLPDGEILSIVDVPGHERFVSNMLAGVGGIDMALLVVAADESVMPQTREHVDILDLLGVRRGVVALTKCDLVDDDLRDLASEEVAELLSRTSLAGSPVVPVSAVTGEGTDQLLSALSDAARSVPARGEGGSPYLPVDRVFTLPGFGTVVTGTLHDGSLSLGDDVELLPSGRRARVRSLQIHGGAVERALPGSRVAANLPGIEVRDVTRGDVVARPGRIVPTRRFDAGLRVVADAPFALKHGQEVALHLGSGEYRATVSILGDDELAPGESGWVQVRARTPVPAVRRERFILRLPAPARTIAGGSVIDPRPRHRRGDSPAQTRLEALASGDPGRELAAALDTPHTVSRDEVVAITGLAADEVDRALVRASEEGRAVPIGPRYAGPRSWALVSGRVERELSTYHTENPLRRGMPREELRRKIRRAREEWPAWLEALVRRGVVKDVDGLVALPNFEGAGRERRAEADVVLAILARSPTTPPSAHDLQSAAGTDEALLTFMADSGEIVHIGGGIYFAPQVYEQLAAIALDIISRHGSVTIAQFRDAAGTSRRYAQAFLEHLDARRITRRQGDVRVRGREAPACAQG